MTILVPKLASALRDTLSFDLKSNSFTLLERLFTWDEEVPSKDALCNFVRDTVHARRTSVSPRPDTDAALLNDLVSGITGSTSHFAPWAEPNRRNVILDGVRVRIPHAADTQVHEDGVLIQVPKLRPRLTPGYAHVINVVSPSPIVGATRIYLSAEGVAQLTARWHAALSALVRKRILFRAKFVTSPMALPRSDAIVFLSRDPRSVRAIVEAIRQDRQETMRTSLFGLEVAPGVALGVEPPLSIDGGPVSFGTSRSLPVAMWLLQGITAGLHPEIRDLSQKFEAHGIDPQQTWVSLGAQSGDPLNNAINKGEP
ncbi:hypothetical protein ICM05_07280 [Leucobacter sp. cx-42]|uniref:T3SS effector HopA1 family protein n=1 Tax=unclassified Leucobacter TaxID=2621730 RepID=UPI00165EB8D7|nr:hypothetical protein [Leucobacter sp. cx-42]